MSARAFLLGVAAACVMLAAEVWISGASVVSHPMWLDESVTSLLLNDPSARHMLAAIGGGVDTNGPAFYFTIWPVVHIVGGAVSHLRLISASLMGLALVGIYMVCRSFVEPSRAAIGTLAAAVHPFVIVQMWQVRMYGFWLAAIAWFCVYTVAVRDKQSWPLRAAGCLLAVLVVTAHWLGVFALVLISVAALVETRDNPVRRWNHLLPLLAGLVVLMACIPLILEQRHVVSVPTWIDPASLATVGAQLRWIVLVPGCAVLLGYGLIRLFGRGERGSFAKWPTAVVSVFALFLFPGTLIAMSVGMQSVLVERYMIPVVIPIGLLTALAALPLRGRGGWVIGAIAAAALVAIGGRELKQLRTITAEDDLRASLVIDIVSRSLATGQRVVFARRFEAYPLIQARSQWADSVALLDFSGTPVGLMRRTIFERDLGRAVARFYGQYHLVTTEQLRAWGRSFVVITHSGEEDELRRLLPGFRVAAVGTDQYVVEWQ